MPYKNPEDKRAESRRWFQRTKQDPKRRARKYARARRWQLQNPSYMLLSRHKHRYGHHLKNELPEWLYKLLRFLSFGRCLACKRKADKLELDHIVSLKDGGRHHISNVQFLCKACNGRKKDETTDYRPLGWLLRSIK